MTEATAPIEVFCCYSHKDETWLRKLEIHLRLFQRQGLVSLWHDRLIAPGANWAQTIDIHLETASVILLLVSADFLASDYCYSIEMKRALERHAANEARVIPILVRPVDWTDAPFAHLQSLPTDAKPLTTWQDEDTALTNVVAGIRRILEDFPRLSANAPRAALPAIWNVPYSRNPFFLGRDGELALIHKHLHAGLGTALSQPQAISGLGGIGKTQLVLEYAYRYHQDYQAVLWARAESTAELNSSYLTLASLLRLPESKAKTQNIAVQVVKMWLQAHRGWLLILDNADELQLTSNFLPPQLAGHVLLTTRATATGRLAHRLEIKTLELSHGALLLLRRATLIAPDALLKQASKKERELAAQLSQELGGLPLALDQAGAYLEETGCGLAGYQQVYQQRRMELLKRRGGFASDHPASVATTWSLSFQRVEEKNPAAAELLRLCAFLPPDNIPEEILPAGASFLGPVLSPAAADAFQRNQAIEALLAYSLVRRDPREKELSVHRLVQAVLQDTLEEEEKHTWGERATNLLNNLATLYVKQGEYTKAEVLYMQALEISVRQSGEEHLDLVPMLSGLANIYSIQGKYVEAEQLFQRALHIFEYWLGSDHPAIASVLYDLANVYSMKGSYRAAEPLFQRALHIFERQLGPDHPNMAHSLNGLAVLYYEQGKYAEAEPLFQRALHIFEQQLGLEHFESAQPMHDLALLREAQSNNEEARNWYARALAVREQALGRHHPKTTETRTRLIALLHKIEQHEEAAQLDAAQSEP